MLFSLRWIVGDRTYSTDQAFAEQDASIIELPHNLTSSTSASDSLPWTAKGRTKYMDLEVGSITSYVIVSWEGGRKKNLGQTRLRGPKSTLCCPVGKHYSRSDMDGL